MDRNLQRTTLLTAAGFGLVFGLGFALLSPAGAAHAGDKKEKNPICGNGKVEGTEECDDGPGNCDGCKDACRTDCTLPRCGDGAPDSNEECDDGKQNDPYAPGACRMNCKHATCGDGHVDTNLGEMCDDANTNAYDGCHECQLCVRPKDDLKITGYTKLCPGTYQLTDRAGNGVIRVTGKGAHLDCNGAVLRGPIAQRQPTSVPAPQAPPTSPPKSNRKGRRSKAKAGSASLVTTPDVIVTAVAPAGPSYVSREGIGISIEAEDAVVHDCKVENYRTGVVVKKPNAVVFHNLVCGNTKDLDGGKTNAAGARNTCDLASGWREASSPSACSNRCSTPGHQPQTHP